MTRSPTVARTADRTGCQWPSRSSKVNDFYLIIKNACPVINSNLGPISHRFRDTANYSLTFPLKTAAKPLQIEKWLILLTAYRKLIPPYPNVPSPTPYNLPFSHNTSVTDGETAHRAIDALHSLQHSRHKTN